MVPVLSLNRMFRLPAVSMPETLRTSTLSLSIFPIFWADTIAIMRGRPSGTAMTMMITASMTASTALFSRDIQLPRETETENSGKKERSTIFWNMKATAMAMPPM